MEAQIIVRPKHDWLRRALAGREAGLVDGNTYRLDLDGNAAIPADVAQQDHPDWELVSGTPVAREVDPVTGQSQLAQGPLVWIEHRFPRMVAGREVSGPAPMNFPAVFDAQGRAAVHENSGFDGHPDYVLRGALSLEEASFHREAYQRRRAVALQVRATHLDSEAVARARIAGIPTTGNLAGTIDPNSTGVPGIFLPPAPQAPGAAVAPGAPIVPMQFAPGAPGMTPPAPPAAAPAQVAETLAFDAAALEAQMRHKYQLANPAPAASTPVAAVASAPGLPTPLAPPAAQPAGIAPPTAAADAKVAAAQDREREQNRARSARRREAAKAAAREAMGSGK